jgi:hypothetical protein
MSYVKCPDCGRKISVFGESRLDDVANELKMDVLGRLPLDSELAKLSDSGLCDRFYANYRDEAAKAIENKFKAEK